MHTGHSWEKHTNLVFLSLERGQKYVFPDAIDDDVVEGKYNIHVTISSFDTYLPHSNSTIIVKMNCSGIATGRLNDALHRGVQAQGAFRT